MISSRPTISKWLLLYIKFEFIASKFQQWYEHIWWEATSVLMKQRSYFTIKLVFSPNLQAFAHHHFFFYDRFHFTLFQFYWKKLKVFFQTLIFVIFRPGNFTKLRSCLESFELSYFYHRVELPTHFSSHFSGHFSNRWMG